MSQSSFPAILNDWHQYRLCAVSDAGCNSKASLFATGGTYKASDTKDMGADLSKIDAAQTSTRYCTPTCAVGAFSDVQ